MQVIVFAAIKGTLDQRSNCHSMVYFKLIAQSPPSNYLSLGVEKNKDCVRPLNELVAKSQKLISCVNITKKKLTFLFDCQLSTVYQVARDCTLSTMF